MGHDRYSGPVAGQTMANKLDYAASEATLPERHGMPELALFGADPKC